MSLSSRSIVIALALLASLAAHAQDEEAEPAPEPGAMAPAAASALEADSVDVHDGISFTGRAVGVPAMMVGGALLGAGLHALAVADALGTSGLGTAAYWTELGGFIAVAVSALPLLLGEVGLIGGSVADLLSAIDMSAAEADGTGLAWTRLGTWQLAGQTVGLGAGLTLGGVLSMIAAIVLPSVFAFDAAGVAAYDDLFALSVTTTVFGAIAVVVAAIVGGVSVWLSGAVTNAYKRAAAGGVTAELPPSHRRAGVEESTLAMAY